MREDTQNRRSPWAIAWAVLRGIGIAISSLVGLLVTLGAVAAAQGFLARERFANLKPELTIPHSGTFAADREGTPIELGIMGDSLAAGYGADDPASTPGVLLAEGLVEAGERPVTLTNVAEVGAESTALEAQLARLLSLSTPDVVVILIGANDVMHLKRLTDALWPLAATVRHLHSGGTEVVVATCPDLGTVRPFMPLLRFLAHWYSRVLATGQAIVTLRASGRTVSLADTLGAIFRRDPATMFSLHDHLHPSSRGYAEAARVILPSVRVAAGVPLPEDANVPHRVYQKGSRRPLAWLAFRASRRVGDRLVPVS
ncbi:SGNH/GDSL hydrolase family protein [Microbacterium sp.]|uniref:SGNH/GDSL hydrolase family protein n=1 Tax=Microbacterium sp. TaxID=51671 RepID=UPI0026154F6B|nr:SGNH/GDSL hydrolase family protein [Microbacterium sp.]